MNRRGQVFAPLAILGSLILFWIMWAMGIGTFVNTWSANLVAAGPYTGMEGFLAGNLNLWIILGVHFTALVGFVVSAQ